MAEAPQPKRCVYAVGSGDAVFLWLPQDRGSGRADGEYVGPVNSPGVWRSSNRQPPESTGTGGARQGIEDRPISKRGPHLPGSSFGGALSGCGSAGLHGEAWTTTRPLLCAGEWPVPDKGAFCEGYA